MPQGLAKVVGRNVRRLRKKAKLSQEALGELAGLHKNTVLYIEKGHNQTMLLETVELLAAVLGADPLDLLTMRSTTVGDIQPLVDEYLQSPYAAITQPTPEEVDWLRHSRTLVLLEGRPGPDAIDALLTAHRRAG